MTASDVAVWCFGGRSAPRRLDDLPALAVDDLGTVFDSPADGPELPSRVAVVGSDADLAAVLRRLLRSDRLDVEVAYVPRRRTPATRAYQLPTGGRAARAVRAGTAQRVPLIRDESGRVLVGAALWVGGTGLEKGGPAAALNGEAVVDDTVLFDGSVPAVRVEPTRATPGLRASVLNGRMRAKRWAAGRAAQLGTPGALVALDGELSTRAVRRSTFYRHTTGWLAVS